MEKSLLIQYLGDTTKLRIIDFFLENRSDYSKKEIIENIGISKTTFYKVWKELAKFDIVKETRRYGKARLYTLNENNPLIEKVMALDAELGKQAMNKTLLQTKMVKVR
ncbi:MAG: DNA-binding transcriptional regulator GbsR (MarR family) [Candidatus Nitrosomirales archaeon]|jgi:DNA-binding transcriptional regulator GbsR (MarR family)